MSQMTKLAACSLSRSLVRSSSKTVCQHFSHCRWSSAKFASHRGFRYAKAINARLQRDIESSAPTVPNDPHLTDLQLCDTNVCATSCESSRFVSLQIFVTWVLTFIYLFLVFVTVLCKINCKRIQWAIWQKKKTEQIELKKRKFV